MEYKYTFRPELGCDAIKLLDVKDFEFITIIFHAGILQRICQVDFTSTLTIHEVRACMKQVIDGHVMVQTLNYSDKYDGERWYEEWNQ